jgi:hypothetical protein
MKTHILNKLYSQLKDKDTCTLDRSILEAGHIPALWEKCFEINELPINTMKVSSNNESIIIQGKTPKLLGIPDQDLTITFFSLNDIQTGDERLECVIESTLPENWNFSHSYPDMPGYTNFSPGLFNKGKQPSFFKELGLKKPKLLFASCDYSNNDIPPLPVKDIDDNEKKKIHQGLNFTGGLVLSGILSMVSDFMGKEISVSIHGSLREIDGDERIYLIADLPFEVSLGPVTFKLSHIGIFSSLADRTSWSTSGISIYGSISVGNVVLDIRADFSIGSNIVTLEGTFENLDLPGLGDLAGLVGGESLEKHLPESFRSLGGLSIKKIGMELCLSPLKVKALTLGIQATNEWTVIPNILEVKDALLQWYFLSPFDKSRQFIFQVDGIFQIGSAVINVSTQFPDFQLLAELAPGSTINISDMFGHFSLNQQTIPQLSIINFEFGAFPAEKTIHAYIDISSDLKIETGGKDFVLTGLTMEFDYMGGPQKSITGFIKGIANIAGIDIFVSAEHPEAGAGWEFSGGTGAGQEIPIGELIDDIANLFGNVTLPEPVKDLVIQNLYVSFNTKTKDFSFSGEARFPIDDKEVDIIVTIDIRHTGTAGQKAVEISFSGKIVIGTMEFVINFEKDPTSTILAATYSHTPDRPKLKIKDLVSNISSEAAAFIPESLEIDLKDVLFVYSKTGTSKFLLGMDIGTHISLSDLPVAGSAIAKDQDVGIDDLQILVASRDFTRNEVTTVNSILPARVTRLAAARSIHRYRHRFNSSSAGGCGP